jgi:NTE family protein
VGGRTLIDGAVANNAPISHAVALGAETVYVLPTGYACALERPPRHPLAMTLQAISLLLQRRLIQDVERYDGVLDLRVAPPLCPLSVSPADFSQARHLIARARGSTVRWLEQGPPAMGQARVLSFHPHHHFDHSPAMPTDADAVRV